ncbi:MAG: nuclear transport factor 2 family protein [SAR202 cluster bacterium]|nr:nuclear transport factor 2 family protein [SAR202 cluster bacterium]
MQTSSPAGSKPPVGGDATYADKHLSKRSTMLLVGTDPEEWIRGKAAAKFLMNEARASGGKVKVSVGKVEAYMEGSVGWGIANPTITLPNGKKFQPRWSAVFHKERGKWKIIQIHASVGVPNEQILA